MARFELNIYGVDDEIIKTYKADRVKYGVTLEALKYAETVDNMSTVDKFLTLNKIVKRVFPGLTDEELMNTEIDDVLNVCRQVGALTGNIDSSKN